MEGELQTRRLEGEIERAERHYERLRRRTSRWLERRHLNETVREYLLLLPDMFMLLIRLLRDPRVNRGLKAQLVGATAYVIAPVDFIPDFIVPFGLTDDMVAVAFIISRIVAIMGAAGEDVLREHWPGRGDVLGLVRSVLGSADKVLNHRVLGWLRGRFFGKKG